MWPWLDSEADDERPGLRHKLMALALVIGINIFVPLFAAFT